MKKEIKFSAKLDSEEFNRSIEQMQRKLKEIYAPNDLMKMQNQTAGRLEGAGVGGMSKASQEQYQRATNQTRRELDQSLQKEAQTQEKLGKIIEKRTSMLKELKKQQDDVTKGSAEELRLKEKISKVEENNYRLRENYRARDQAINQTLDARDSLKPKGLERLATAYQHGGIGGAATAGGRMIAQMGPAGWVGMGATAIAGIASGAKAGGEIYNAYKNAPISTAANYGSAMSGTLGKEAAAAYSGRSAYEMAFMPEKIKALQMAKDGMKGERVKNGINAVADPIITTAQYAAKGAAWGAGIGGVIGGVAGGVAGAPAGGVGAIPGAAAGAAGGAKAGGWLGAAAGTAYGSYQGFMGNMGDPKKRALSLSPFSSTFNNEYEGMMAKDFSAKYQESLQGLKEQNPMKTLAAEHYNQNYMKNLSFQRSTGLNYDSFHGKGGFREGAINAGFTDDMAMEASGQVLGAGGSTRMAQDSSFALKAGRGANLTNAAQTLGTLSNSIGDSETSKQTYIKMMAEGTRLGLDSSSYAEENRKFMDATATVLNKSNTSSGNDLERMMSLFSSGVTDKTGKGIQAAQDAFNTYNENSSQTSGARGVMRATAFLKDDKIGAMDALDRQALANVSQDQLAEDNPVVRSLARKYNMDPKDLVGRSVKANQSSYNTTSLGDSRRDKSQAIQKQLAELGTAPADIKRREDLTKQLQEANDDYAVAAVAQDPSLGTNTAKLKSTVGLATALGPAGKMKTEAEQNKLDNQNTGKVEDESVAGAAEASRVVLKNFIEFKDQLVPAAKAIHDFNLQIDAMIKQAEKLNPADRAKFYESLGGLYGMPAPSNQPTAGKPGN